MEDLVHRLRQGLLVLVLAGKAYSVAFRAEAGNQGLTDYNDSRSLLGLDDRTAALLVGTRCLGTFVQMRSAYEIDDDCALGTRDGRFAELYDVSEGAPHLLEVLDWTPLG